MALKATIYKAVVNVADLDRNQFLDASLTLARHPSETQERMMLRLLAWIKYADERLQFTRGLSAEDEPEAWLRNDHLGIDLWIELGLPDERRIKKACTQSAEVALFAYNQRAAEIWWQQNKNKCAQFKNLTVWYLDDEQLAQLSAFASRTMALQATIQDGAIWLSDSQNNLEIHLTAWQPVSGLSCPETSASLITSWRSPPSVLRAQGGSTLTRPQRLSICALTSGPPACQSIIKKACSPPAII